MLGLTAGASAPESLVREVAAMPGISSVQITFHEHKAPEQHSMPPGGFRVAIVNAFDLEQGDGQPDDHGSGRIG